MYIYIHSILYEVLLVFSDSFEGIWLAKPKLLKSLPSADPTQFRDLKSGK